jgi:hypothetical protein
MCTPLERSICLLGQVWAFGSSFWAFSKPSSWAHYSKLFLIDKIVSSLGPGIPNFGKYKLGCLQRASLNFRSHGSPFHASSLVDIASSN